MARSKLLKKPIPINNVLALDAATVNTGWAIIDRDINLNDYGLIHAPSSQPPERRLKLLYNSLIEIIDTHTEIDCVAVEDQFLGDNVKTIKALSWARGVIMLLSSQFEIPIVSINNKTAKKVIAGGNATKSDVIEATSKEFNLPKDLDDNISDAIAIGLAYWRNSQ